MSVRPARFYKTLLGVSLGPIGTYLTLNGILENPAGLGAGTATTACGLRCGGRLKRHRVLRGGAFNNNERNVRCANRNRNNPDNNNKNNGFRVCVSPIFFIPARIARRLWLPGRGQKIAEPVPGRVFSTLRLFSFGREAGGEGDRAHNNGPAPLGSSPARGHPTSRDLIGFQNL